MISGGAHLTTPFASVSGPMPAFLVRSNKFRDPGRRLPVSTAPVRLP
jgi:hypothetical protein